MTTSNHTSYLKIILLVLIILFISLLIQLIRLPTTNQISQQETTTINYNQLNQKIEEHLNHNKPPKNSLQPGQTLNKLRTALLLYLQDHHQLPADLTQLQGDYLTTIPAEPISNSNQVTTKLNYQGGWHYNPQPTTNKLTTLISNSLQPNAHVDYNTDFQPYQLVIDTQANKLYLQRKKQIVEDYHIATGQQTSPTPKGEFRIKEKAILGPEQRQNYGKYWIGIDLWTAGGGYGLHATTNQQPLTDQKSQGCIRLQPDHLAKLYHLLPLQTKVVIK